MLPLLSAGWLEVNQGFSTVTTSVDTERINCGSGSALLRSLQGPRMRGTGFVEGNAFAITGGCGLVGSHIAERLLKTGASKVILFDNASSPRQLVGETIALDPRVDIVSGDILSIHEVCGVLRDVAGVFHNAAFYHHGLVKNLPLGVDVNIKGTLNVLEACRLTGVRRIAFSSSISAFGNATEEQVDENAHYIQLGVDPVAGIYGVGKVYGEFLCAHYAKEHGLEWTSLRLASVYGARQHRRGLNVRVILSTLDQLDAGRNPSLDVDPEELRDFIHVEDVARAQVAAMASATQNEVFTIASSQPITFRQLVDAVIRVYGEQAVPSFRDDSRRVHAASVTRYSIDKAKAILGWEPEIGIDEGIARLISWRAGEGTTFHR
jgi:UDP-glucose 4-epimerase